MADRQTITIMGGPEWRAWLRTMARVGTTNAQVNNFINLSGFIEPQMLKDMESTDWTSLEKRLLAQNINVPIPSIRILKKAAVAVDYYETCGYPITVESMQLQLIDQIGKTYEMLKDSKKVDDTTKLQSLNGNNKLIGWIPNAKAQLDSILEAFPSPI